MKKQVRPLGRSLSLIFLVLQMLMALISCRSGTQPDELAMNTPDSGIDGNEMKIDSSPVPAFPGAEGFGSHSVGGRGGKVIEVNNLNDDGPGSLRAAINAFGPRIVVFRIGGTIELQSSLEISNPYLTIAGQTAPGGGITLKNSTSTIHSPLIIRTHDVVIRYIRSRPGPPADLSSNGDALAIFGYNVIIDHSSFSWAIDEVVSTWYDAHDITFQWNIISEGLHCSNHTKGCHSMGLLIGSDGSGNISIHNNLFAHNHERNPMIKSSGLVDMVNNVIYNPWGTPLVVIDEYGMENVNSISNYFKPGVDTVPGKHLVSAKSLANKGIEIFVYGNITPHRLLDSLPQWLAVNPGSRKWLVMKQHITPPITITSAFEAYDRVLADAGASSGLDSQGNLYRRRDAVDDRIVTDVKLGTGNIIDDPYEVGGWPELAAGAAPTDTDHDGMPDVWEGLFGLDRYDSSDGPGDADQDGYTNIEEYLNSTNPISSQ